MLKFLSGISQPIMLKIMAGFFVAMLAYVGWLHLNISGLELVVSEKEKQITKLKAAIDTQNREVQRWKDVADDKQKRAAEALEEAERLGKLADERLRKLRATEAVTCAEGVELIDEALGL